MFRTTLLAASAFALLASPAFAQDAAKPDANDQPVSTQSRPTGWKQSPTTISVKEGSFPGFKVDSFGKAPWQMVRPKMTVTVKNPALKKATVLDVNGNAAGTVPLTKVANGVRFSFPETALYVVLQ